MEGPPKPPTPGDAAKAVKGHVKGVAGILKGKPAWMWVAGITVLVGVAYLAWHRSANQVESSTTTDPAAGDGTGAVGGSFSDGYVTPAPTQGAGDFGTGTVTDNAGSPEPMPPVIVNVTYPDPVAGVDSLVPAGEDAVITGGGHPDRSVATHTSTAPNRSTAGAHTNTQANNPRHGLRYQTRTRKDGSVVHEYESRPGRGDYGQGKVIVVHAAPHRTAAVKGGAIFGKGALGNHAAKPKKPKKPKKPR